MELLAEKLKDVIDANSDLLNNSSHTRIREAIKRIGEVKEYSKPKYKISPIDITGRQFYSMMNKPVVAIR